ncbi:chromosome partitioning protein ParB [Globicatella sp. HMSC072A10]|uniref:ParB/RepB/Spo0J family partition protein n=1 Tax=Globicatella sp. HMSC072A10 TaxID=1739315 RepID=UPI0008C47658|nr:ParB/RepB/Spo0J family partition protein [Globicatella sp. HMSC072A10]OFK58060.1 chromosome partitioning protein ParB [Globicatella sp. HMSC072A10]
MANKAKKGGLGRGMDALFSTFEETPNDNEVVVELKVSDIRSNPYQPRKNFDEKALQELADSIKQSGVFQPIIVRRSTIKGYELIAGERRVRASQLAGKETIPAIVRQIDEEQMIEIAVLENLQREDLSPMEEAEAYNVLMEKLKLTQAEVAERMGKSRPYIANYLRLLALPETVKELLNDNSLSMGQARTLLALKDKSKVVAIAEKVVKDQLTVRQLEELVQSLNEKKDEPEKKDEKNKPASKPTHILAVEERMQEYFGTAATVHQKGDRGKIEIEFLSQSDLIRILDLLNIHL